MKYQSFQIPRALWRSVIWLLFTTGSAWCETVEGSEHLISPGEIAGTAAPNAADWDRELGALVRVEFPEPFAAVPAVAVEPLARDTAIHVTTSGFETRVNITKSSPVSDVRAAAGSGFEVIQSAFAVINHRPAFSFIYRYQQPDGEPKRGLRFASASDSRGNEPWRDILIDELTHRLDDREATSLWYDRLFLGSHQGRPVIMHCEWREKGIITLAAARDAHGEGPWHSKVLAIGVPFAWASSDGSIAMLFTDGADVVTFACPTGPDPFGPWTFRSIGAGFPREFSFLNGRPAALLESNSVITFAIASDQQGADPWKTRTILTNAFAVGMSMIEGLPTVAYEVAEGVQLTQASDPQGERSWTTFRIAENASGASLALLGDKPYVAYVEPLEGESNRMVIARPSEGGLARPWITQPLQTNELGGRVELTFAGGYGVLTHHFITSSFMGRPSFHKSIYVSKDLEANGLTADFWSEFGIPMEIDGRLAFVRDRALEVASFPIINWRATPGPQLRISKGVLGLAPSPFLRLEAEADVVSTALEDFNGDGRTDLVAGLWIGSTNGLLKFYPGDGAGRFTSDSARTIQLPFPVLSLTAGDINKDGKPDIAGLGGFEGDTLIVLLADGDRGFSSPISTPLPSFPAGGGSRGTNLYISDVNHDGNPDFLIVIRVAPFSNLPSLLVLLGDGDGGAQAALISSFVVNGRAGSVAVADLNRDGNPDLLVSTTEGKSVVLLLGDGKGQFTIGSDAALQFEENCSWVEPADVNGDGIVDLIASLYTPGKGRSSITALLGDAAGNFRPAAGSPVPDAYYIASGDFDQDGKLDLLAGDSLANDNQDVSSVIILRGDGAGRFTPGTHLPVDHMVRPNPSGIADLTEDGWLDFVSSDSNGNIQILLGVGRNSSIQLDLIGVPNRPYQIEWSKSLDRDSWRPLVTRSAGPDGRFQASHQSSAAQLFYRTLELPQR